MPRSPSRIAAPLAIALLTLGAGLTACGSDDERASGAAGSASSVPVSEPFNDADVRFATDMIPHHAQALSMVDLTRGRDLEPAFERLTQQILDAQGPEIQTMAGWLQDWDQPIPATERDHVNAEEHGETDGETGGETGSGSSMPGMMSGAEMADLDSAPDSSFEGRWLQMMIEHHEGAIEMARTELRDGELADATALAGTIATDQEQQVTQMKAMLEG